MELKGKFSILLIYLLAFFVTLTGMASHFPRTIIGQNCPAAAKIASLTETLEDDNDFVQCKCDERKAKTASMLVLFSIPPCIFNSQAELLDFPILPTQKSIFEPNNKIIFRESCPPDRPPLS